MMNSGCSVYKKYCRREKQCEYAVFGRRNFSPSYYHHQYSDCDVSNLKLAQDIHLASKGDFLLL